MRPDPALQARTSSRFTLMRALLAALVLVVLALLPAICRGTSSAAGLRIPAAAVSQLSLPRTPPEPASLTGTNPAP